MKYLKPPICDGVSRKIVLRRKHRVMDDCHTQQFYDIVICDIAKQIAKSPYRRFVGLVVRKKSFP